MPPYHLLFESEVDVTGAEGATFFGEDHLERQIEEEVSELARQLVVRALADGVHHLVSFLQ